MPTNPPLDTEVIGERLDEALDAVLGPHRRTAPLAIPLAALSRGEQDRVLSWVDVIAKTNAELAFRFAERAPAALGQLDAAGLEAWAVEAMDVYDHQGLYPACTVIDDVDIFAREIRERASGVALEDAARVLELFLRGLSGRHLALHADDAPYTDTEALYLPAHIARYPDRATNFRLYKAMAAHLLAQTCYGTFRAPVNAALSAYPDSTKALALFYTLETLRLDACLARDLPGLHAEMAQLRGPEVWPAAWREHVVRLQTPDASVGDTLAAVAALYEGPLPPPAPYQGVLRLAVAEDKTSARQTRERAQLQTGLARLLAQHEQGGELRARKRADIQTIGAGRFEITVDGHALAVPAEVQTLLDSIAQDLGTIPDDYLMPGEPRGESAASPAPTVDAGEDDGVPYDEWDYRRGHYRKAWCTVRESEVTPGAEPFVRETLQKYAGLAATLRKTFEALRRDHCIQRRQSHGDDLDLDALVQARVDLRTGTEMSERVFVKTRRIERDIAVMFMVDMSGSTKGWINEAERESLVLLCEALEILGDRYAIYGFSGITRKRCEIYRVKRFDETYDGAVKQRIAGIQPQDYTRMGAAIRYLGDVLEAIDARTKLLITLSDGRPDDYDGYRGDYGIEDTRQALVEIKRAGIHPFCVTIDTDARDYLPHMYGAANYTVIDNVRKLPYRVSDVYRKLTA